jgi:hypothetical protein
LFLSSQLVVIDRLSTMNMIVVAFRPLNQIRKVERIHATMCSV